MEIQLFLLLNGRYINKHGKNIIINKSFSKINEFNNYF